jgi:hypothetical protein
MTSGIPSAAAATAAAAICPADVAKVQQCREHLEDVLLLLGADADGGHSVAGVDKLLGITHSWQLIHG